MALNSKYARRVRQRLAAQQANKCCYCGRSFTSDGPRKATIEHRIPKVRGGRDRIANFAVACLHCNQHRGRQIEQGRRARGSEEKRPDS